MKSGLEGRNNGRYTSKQADFYLVSMKSGLEGRNNDAKSVAGKQGCYGLNEVRPRRPEQSTRRTADESALLESQ